MISMHYIQVYSFNELVINEGMQTEFRSRGEEQLEYWVYHTLKICDSAIVSNAIIDCNHCTYALWTELVFSQCGELLLTFYPILHV
jgi:hypothetical protein